MNSAHTPASKLTHRMMMSNFGSSCPLLFGPSRRLRYSEDPDSSAFGMALNDRSACPQHDQLLRRQLLIRNPLPAKAQRGVFHIAQELDEKSFRPIVGAKQIGRASCRERV